MNSKQNCWLAAYVFANTNRLFLWPLSSLHQCFLSVQFATICSNQSVLTDFYQKSFQVLVLKMLTFCYLGLKKVTLVNQLSLLLIFKTTIGETWNAAYITIFFSQGGGGLQALCLRYIIANWRTAWNCWEHTSGAYLINRKRHRQNVIR